ncbi:DUF6443 domain-containing protein [uncultured Chryseobacterium sp.]|uniref:DUF6443 domain-containing protein n=2 Tax=Chryseobacterium TaxID=59732 RepID=UPI0025FB01BA|nr:DUF6443 domain-containing protein [uncultured Chryseobacterium sp.]
MMKHLIKRKENAVMYASLLIFLFSGSALAQTNLSTDKNFIYTKSCLDADCVKKSESVQYFDGLGRPVQSVAIGASPLGKDVVVPVEYNPVGKQVKDYLPVPQSGTSGGAFYDSPFDGVPAAYGTEKIYSEKIYDNVYTDRVKQVVSVGTAWTQKPVSLGYDTNADGEVKKYRITTTWTDGRTDSQITMETPYAANQLMKSSATDPDGNTTVEFKNGEGQTILVRKNDGTQDVDTYYLYNEYGQLAYVIPPIAVNKTLDPVTLDKLCYQYRYDGMGKMVEKKVPGRGWEYMIYDKQDRVIMTQHAGLRTVKNSFSAQGWMFTKYDRFGRVVYTGFFPSTASRASLQVDVDALSSNPANNESRVSSSFASDGMDIFYTQNAFPAANIKVLSVNYYDTYPVYSFNPAFPATVMGQDVITDSQNASISTRALPTVSLVKNIEDNGWTKSYVYYDLKGRSVSTYAINHLGGYTKTESELDFAGVVKQTKVYHKRQSGDTEKVIAQAFEYDTQNRLKKQWHQVNGGTQELLSENSYNELSQLTNKKVGNNLQSIDYTYNIRGSVTKVNDPSNLGTKLFGYELKYFNPQNAAASAGKYNGNISEVTWMTATDGVKRRYNYRYDALNRLTQGLYSEPENTVPKDDFYNESVTYDMNSNILSLQRNGKNVLGLKGTIDNLAYIYDGNKLNSVTDDSHDYAGYPDVSGNTIPYDDNGNMISHADKGIVEIAYNIMDQPDFVKFDKMYVPRVNLGGDYHVNTQYLYRADGSKLRKTYTYGSGKTNSEVNTITEYLDGFQYEATNTGSKFALILKFVPTSEGYYDFEKNKYIYSYTDHLGNIRLSYFKNTSGSAEVLEENNFYPFGLKHEGYNAQAGNPSYNYQYNSKELQKETGWSDYGARMYMSDIGRWGVIDPLSEQYRRLTPYNYVGNNPINFIDPDGRKMMAPTGNPDSVPQPMVQGGMMDYYAHGGKGSTSDILKFLGQEDMLGNYYALYNSGGGGSSASSAEDNINSFVRNGVSYEVAVKVSQNGAISFDDFASSSSSSPSDIIILNASEGAGGKGHSGLIIGNEKDGYIYIASNGRVDSSGSMWMGGKNDVTIKVFKTRLEAMNFAKTQYKYDDSITIKTNRAQDLAASQRAIEQTQSNYHFLFNNCNHIISAALVGAGLSQFGGISVVPNGNFKELKNNFQKK